MTNSQSDHPGENRVCRDCVSEPYLKRFIATSGARDSCSYCDEENHTLSIDEMANVIERAFDDHYERTATEPDGLEYAMSRDPDMNYDWDREGEAAKWAILNAADVSEEIAEDIRVVLEDLHYDRESAEMGYERPFSRESHYAEKHAGHGKFPQLWKNFENGLKTETRFFSRSAKSILGKIFAGVADLRTIHGAPAVIAAGPDTPLTTLFRARVFAGEDEKLKEALKTPWKDIGTPPASAANAGRMNARGIAVFYGAKDARTAIAEVRPPVGSKVALARFDIVRQLQILDLTALKSIAAAGSIFDPATIERMQHGNFLEELSNLMSCAVMPHEEALEYLPTQAVADFLANEVELDGIIFPSIQTGQESSNVVLFHHAALVEETKLPKGTKVDAHLETADSDGLHPDYWVSETVPALAAHNEPEPSSFPFSYLRFQAFAESSDTREPSLRIDSDSIEIHHVNAVVFSAEAYSVRRHRG